MPRILGYVTNCMEVQYNTILQTKTICNLPYVYVFKTFDNLKLNSHSKDFILIQNLTYERVDQEVYLYTVYTREKTKWKEITLRLERISAGNSNTRKSLPFLQKPCLLSHLCDSQKIYNNFERCTASDKSAFLVF